VRGDKDTIERGDKLRTSVLTIVGICDEGEVRDAVRVISQPFGGHANAMVESQMAWRRALARPYHDERVVGDSLADACCVRDLAWSLRRYETAGELSDRSYAWYARRTQDTRDARNAWSARASWAAWSSWDAWHPAETREAAVAWPARAVTWEPWGYFTARDADDALTVQFAALMGTTEHDPMLLTTGLRDAYGHGLAVAVPVKPRTLGWAMVEKGS
jgi:hypothetical protein